MSGFGSFVDGLFAGAKATADLMKQKNELEMQYREFKNMDDAKKVADAQVAAERAAKTSAAAGWNAEGTDTVQPGAGPTSPPPAEVLPPEFKPPARSTAINPNERRSGGDMSQADKVAEIIQRNESSGNPNAGYAPPGAPPVDVSKYPARPGFFGFPDWPGNKGPAGDSHAAGLFGIQPGLWQQYAPLANDGKGVNDFSAASQRAVFNEIYRHEGLRPWIGSDSSGRVFNPKAREELAAAGLIGGAGAAAARAADPAAVPSALTGTPTPKTAGGTGPPDIEGQPSKVATGPVPQRPNFAAETIKAITGITGTPAQQANVPEGFATAPPMNIPPPAPSAPPGRGASAGYDPVSTSMASSAMSSPSALASSAYSPVTVNPPSQRPVLAQLRQGGGQQELPSWPGGQGQGQGPPRPPQYAGGMSRSGKVIRLPDGTLVDASGNVVQRAPSALYNNTV